MTLASRSRNDVPLELLASTLDPADASAPDPTGAFAPAPADGFRLIGLS
jgi:hypothetical protein